MSIQRQPAGVPVGGQFAPSVAPEADIDLAGDDTTDGATGHPSYSYKGESYTDGELIERLIAEGEASPAARDMPIDDVLHWIAEANAIDRSTAPSSEFPQPISSQGIVGSDEAKLIASYWYSGQNATYEFVSTGQITAGGVDAWHSNLSEVEAASSAYTDDELDQMRRLVAWIDDEAGRRGVCTDIDTFEEQTGLDDDEVLDHAWSSYSRTSEPFSKWWAANQGVYV